MCWGGAIKMLFKTSITIPANTTAIPIEEELQLVPGRIVEIDVRFPPGCCNLAKIALLLKEQQYWPSEPNTYISGDTFPVTFDEDFELEEQPYIMTIQAFNYDEGYEHTIDIYISMIQSKKALQEYLQKIVGIG